MSVKVRVVELNFCSWWESDQLPVMWCAETGIQWRAEWCLCLVVVVLWYVW
jgi:hypothetical protein